jgi:predicted transcriptional regulator of viral defense system
MDGQTPVRAGEVDRAIAALAARQHGVVRRGQLAGLGLGRGAIEHRLRAGRLYPIHRGVYAVGHRRLTLEAAWLAGVYAAGDGAVLSHRSAAALWALGVPTNGPVEVTSQLGKAISSGVRVHESSIPQDEIVERRRIPVTTVARTLLDYAAVARRAEVSEAFRAAEANRRITAEGLDAALRRHPGRRGNATVRAILKDAGYGRGIRRSRLEARFDTFLRRHGFPAPARNVWMRVGPIDIEADCLWAEQRLIVELDSRTFHDTDSAFENDRARDRTLKVHGWTVVRVTWRHLEKEERQLARDLRALLRRTPD